MELRVACIILLVGGEGMSVEEECITGKTESTSNNGLDFLRGEGDVTCTMEGCKHRWRYGWQDSFFWKTGSF